MLSPLSSPTLRTHHSPSPLCCLAGSDGSFDYSLFSDMFLLPFDRPPFLRIVLYPRALNRREFLEKPFFPGNPIAAPFCLQGFSGLGCDSPIHQSLPFCRLFPAFGRPLLLPEPEGPTPFTLVFCFGFSTRAEIFAVPLSCLSAVWMVWVECPSHFFPPLRRLLSPPPPSGAFVPFPIFDSVCAGSVDRLCRQKFFYSRSHPLFFYPVLVVRFPPEVSTFLFIYLGLIPGFYENFIFFSASYLLALSFGFRVCYHAYELPSLGTGSQYLYFHHKGSFLRGPHSIFLLPDLFRQRGYCTRSVLVRLFLLNRTHFFPFASPGQLSFPF